MRYSIKQAGIAILPLILVGGAYGVLRRQDAAVALEWFRVSGYWGMVMLSFLVAFAVVGVWRERKSLPALPLTRREWAWMLGSAAILSVGVHVIETHGARILWDEVRLTGTSMDMFFRQRAGCVEKVQVLAGDVMVSSATIDKRPLLFPFLVSLFHAFVGYGPRNAVLLNLVLTPVFLGLVYIVVRLFARPPAAVAALLLAVGLPVLTGAMAGAGFELLNVTLILALVVTSWLHARTPGPQTSTLLVAVGCLLAHTRYESGIFFVPIAISLAVSAWRSRSLPISGNMGCLVATLVLLPIQWRVFELNPKMWEMEFRPGSEGVFALRYIPDNLAHAVTFLFGPPSDYGNSLAVSVFGGVGLVGWFLTGRRWLRWVVLARDPDFGPWLHISAMAGHGMLMLAYFYGQFDDGLVSRLAIPLLVFLVIVGAWFVDRLTSNWRVWTAVVLVAATYLLAVARPVVSEGLLLRRNFLARVCLWLEPTAQRLAGKDVLIVDSAGYLFWVHHRVQAMTAADIARRPEAFSFHQKHDTFSEIFVVEWMYLDQAAEGFVPYPGHDVSGLFKLEQIDRMLLSPAEAVRLSRVVDVDLSALDAWCIKHKAAVDSFDRDALNAKLNDPSFFREWGKNLP